MKTKGSSNLLASTSEERNPRKSSLEKRLLTYLDFTGEASLSNLARHLRRGKRTLYSTLCRLMAMGQVCVWEYSANNSSGEQLNADEFRVSTRQRKRGKRYVIRSSNLSGRITAGERTSLAMCPPITEKVPLEDHTKSLDRRNFSLYFFNQDAYGWDAYIITPLIVLLPRKSLQRLTHCEICGQCFILKIKPIWHSNKTYTRCSFCGTLYDDKLASLESINLSKGIKNPKVFVVALQANLSNNLAVPYCFVVGDDVLEQSFWPKPRQKRTPYKFYFKRNYYLLVFRNRHSAVRFIEMLVGRNISTPVLSSLSRRILEGKDPLS